MNFILSLFSCCSREMEAYGRSGNAIVREYLIEWTVTLNTWRRSHSGIFWRGSIRSGVRKRLCLFRFKRPPSGRTTLMIRLKAAWNYEVGCGSISISHATISSERRDRPRIRLSLIEVERWLLWNPFQSPGREFRRVQDITEEVFVRMQKYYIL